MNATLLLWDIDATLVDTGGAGEFALLRAIEEKFGIQTTLAEFDYRGRTDLLIAEMIVSKLGDRSKKVEPMDFASCYLRNLEEELPKHTGRVLPGIERILQCVEERPGWHQGLLTGNMKRGALLKLGHYKIWNYFPFGAFSDDSANRNELGPYALKRAGDFSGVGFAPDRVFVIGDTPHDIACGKAIGARTVAVATGGYRKEELARHEPSHLCDDLSDVDGFLNWIANPV